jgi:leader peptidase (prepilin peptidase) / N-methyltransferase
MLHLSLGIDIYIGVITFILGACVGSFLNCMAWRIIEGESILKGRSHCDVCGHVLSFGDLIPIVSFLVHHGKCRYCGAKLSAGHVFAELSAGLTFVLLLFQYDISFQTLECMLFACILLGAAFADLKGYIIPDRFIVAGIVLRIPFFFLLSDLKGQLVSAVLGGFVVGGGLLLIVLFYEKVRKIEAMGGGDLKLLFVTGLYLGFAKNVLCLLFACVIGIVFALITAKARENQENAKIFPWGPSISAAAILTMLIGNEIIGAYLSLF